MKKLWFLVFVILLSGCSVHQAWNGDKKPGLSYVSIDKSGSVSSNNKGAVLAKETFEELIKNGTEDELVEFFDKNRERSTLFIWSAEYNGAMINGSGSTCMQAASYARSTTTTTDVSSSLITAFTKIDLDSGSETDKLLALSIVEAISNLTETSKQSTYLSAGLFGLCLLHANGGLPEDQLKESVIKVVEASALANNTEKEEVAEDSQKR